MDSVACENNSKLALPKVELSGLDLAKPDEKAWALARAKVACALENYGGFEAVYERVGSQLREDLLGRAVPDFFAAQELSKLFNPTILPYHGILFQKEGFPFLSLQVTDPNSLDAVREYANVIWPEGNDLFCNTVWNYAIRMQELIQIIHMLILESLGLKNHFDSHMKSLIYSMRLSKYNEDLSSKKSSLVLPSHRDPNFISIISQHKHEGLEVETFDGEWIPIAPKPHTFTVLLGEAFMAWTNGRFQAPKHHVKMEGFEKRYSMVYSTYPNHDGDNMIKIPDELVDKEHPLLFKPFNYYEYLKFRFSDDGEKYEDTLKTYCGVQTAEVAA